jgi:hypothetical protein
MTELMKISEEAIKHSVWSVAQVSDQPHITLVRWSVMEAQTTGARRFVGLDVEDCEAGLVPLSKASNRQRPAG